MSARPEVVVLQSDSALVWAEVEKAVQGCVVRQVNVRAPAGIGVTHRMLRDVPLGAIIAEARSRPELPSVGPLPTTSGRTLLTDDLLRQVALVFIEETSPGKDKRAIQRAAERFGRPEGTVRTWVARARKAGWLAPGSKGRIGGYPGPRLLGLTECDHCHGEPAVGFICGACGVVGGEES